MSTSPDQVTAYLDDAQKRWDAFGEADSLPRLIKALNAVLAKHQPGRVLITGALCPRHENHRHFSIFIRLTSG